jgi:hypothetical protein
MRQLIGLEIPAGSTSRREHAEIHQPLGVRKRQRPQHQRIHHRINCGGRTNAQGQRDRRYGGKSRGAREPTQREAQIVQQNHACPVRTSHAAERLDKIGLKPTESMASSPASLVVGRPFPNGFPSKPDSGPRPADRDCVSSRRARRPDLAATAASRPQGSAAACRRASRGDRGPRLS